jgi:hypothetical protein
LPVFEGESGVAGESGCRRDRPLEQQPHGGSRWDRLRVDLPGWRHRQRGDLQHPLPVDAERLATGAEHGGTRARASHGVEEPGGPLPQASAYRRCCSTASAARPGSASNTGVWVRGQSGIGKSSITGANDRRAKPIRPGAPRDALVNPWWD